MSLRANARRLAHPFVRLHACFRKELERLREVRRALKVMRARSPAQIHRIAIHEAGHAALQIALDFDCKAVTVCPIPGRRIAGFSLHGGLPAHISGEKNVAPSERQTVERRELYLRLAMVDYAGAEAVRQLIPTDPDPEVGAWGDERSAADNIIDHIGASPESIYLLFSLARRRCALLVTHYQPEIKALAGALEVKQMLSGKAARDVFTRSLRERSGRLMTFKTDPILHPLAEDEAYQAFLRRLNLRGE